MTLYPSTYRYGRVRIHCTASNATSVQTNWYFPNGTVIGVVDRNFKAGHFSNGSAVLQIAEYRSLSYCDGGNYTCIANSSSGQLERRTFMLVIDCELLLLNITCMHAFNPTVKEFVYESSNLVKQ